MTSCSIDGCAAPASCRGWCAKHYTRWYKHGDPSVVLPRGNKPSDRRCSVDGCDRKHEANGFCRLHGARMRRRGTTDPIVRASEIPCSVEGCNEAGYAKQMCRTHYQRVSRSGRTTAVVRRLPADVAQARKVQLGRRAAKAQSRALLELSHLFPDEYRALWEKHYAAVKAEWGPLPGDDIEPEVRP